MKKSKINFFVFLLLTVLVVGMVNGAITFLSSSPADGAYSNGTNKSVSFTFNYTGGLVGTKRNCTLWLDGVASGMNKTADINKTTTIKANLALTNGTHSWNINCTNSSMLVKKSIVSVTRVLKIDRMVPVVTLGGPANGLNSSTMGQVFSWTAVDYPYGKPLNCSLMINSVRNQTQKWAGLGYSYNSTLKSSATTLFSNGRYSWNVTCIDNATNTNKAAIVTRTVTFDNAKPNVTYINRSQVNEDTSYTLSVNATDAPAGITNCSLYVDSVSNGLMSYSTTTKRATKAVTFSVPKNHTIFAKCIDAAGNINNSKSRVLVVNDTKNPALVVSNTPAAYSISFIANTDDFVNATLKYGVTLSLGTSATIATEKAQNHTYTLSGLIPHTPYYYNLTVCDVKSRCNISSLSFPVSTLTPSDSTSGHSSSSSTSTTTTTTTTPVVTSAIPVVTATTPITTPTTSTQTGAAATSGSSSGSAGATQAGIVEPTTQTGTSGTTTTTEGMSFWEWLKSLFARLFGVFS